MYSSTKQWIFYYAHRFCGLKLGWTMGNDIMFNDVWNLSWENLKAESELVAADWTFEGMLTHKLGGWVLALVVVASSNIAMDSCSVVPLLLHSLVPGFQDKHSRVPRWIWINFCNGVLKITKCHHLYCTLRQGQSQQEGTFTSFSWEKCRHLILRSTWCHFFENIIC